MPRQGIEDLHWPFRQLSAIWPAVCVLWWLRKGPGRVKQRHSHWIVDAIKAAYMRQDLECPLHIRAHSTRATIKRSRGMSIQDICLAAGWSSQNIFARFYKRDVQSLASPVLLVGTDSCFATSIRGCCCSHSNYSAQPSMILLLMLSSMISVQPPLSFIFYAA